MSCYQYQNFHYKNKTVSWPSYLYNGNLYNQEISFSASEGSTYWGWNKCLALHRHCQKLFICLMKVFRFIEGFGSSIRLLTRLPWNKKQTYRKNSRPQMWPSGLTLAMTLTLNFQDQICNLLFLSQKWSDCQENKSKHNDWTQGLECYHQVWPWP